MNNKYAGIIFDMDGVFVASELLYYQRRKDFLANYQLSIDSLPITSFVGADMRSLWSIILKHNKSEYDEAFLEREYLDYKKQYPIDYRQVIDPEAKRTLQFFKRNKYKVALASSSDQASIHEVLAVDNLLVYFDVVVSGTQFSKSKPSPEIYIHTAAKLGLPPQKCLVIEDSEKGIRAAHDAEMTVWAIADGQFGMDQDLADRKINSLGELCQAIQLRK